MGGRETNHLSDDLRERSNRPWPLLALIAGIAGLYWWFDLRKPRIQRVATQPVADPGKVRDMNWADKTVVFTETAEEVMVGKSARIAEVVMWKTGSDRVETVRETVRRQQVEVENVPASQSAKTSD